MGIINVLPTDISNKIAAGEVVERPASVIKELVENAIDAGASVIGVEIKKGGVSYIRVSDNGKGMEASDAARAFLRHATSKIQTENDLDAIYTLGFRGEALSSIGAVASVDLFTKRREDSVGTHVVCTGGVIESSSDAGTPDGTTIVVNSLFYNTPARMNFLKRDATESGYVTDIMERFILSHPEIAFRYSIDGKERYYTSGDGSIVNCIYAIYGKSYAKSVIPVDYQTESFKITGMIGKGDAARPNRSYQSFFVNKRYIKSLKISNAVEAAYKNQIMIGKHPMAILNIEINPKFTDINVHPTKLEVKFSREEEVMSAFYHCVKNALYAIPNVPQIERKPARSEFVRDSVTSSGQMTMEQERKNAPEEKDAATASVIISPEVQEPPLTDTVTKTEVESSTQQGGEKPAAAEEKPQEDKKQQYALNASNEYFIKKQNDIAASYKPEYEIREQSVAEDFKSGGQIREYLFANAEIPEKRQAFVWGFDTEDIRIVGQIFDTYIIAQSGDTMIIADQHAAHERLKYEELKKDLENKQLAPQILMIPVSVDLAPREFAAYAEQSEVLYNMGFETEIFGTSTILVRTTPEPLEESELKLLVLELITQLADGRQEIMAQKTERALYTIACKAAVKANHKFDSKQLEQLLKAVLALENINTCPHGRPIITTMTKKELEKEFKRIL